MLYFIHNWHSNHFLSLLIFITALCYAFCYKRSENMGSNIRECICQFGEESLKDKFFKIFKRELRYLEREILKVQAKITPHNIQSSGYTYNFPLWKKQIFATNCKKWSRHRCIVQYTYAVWDKNAAAKLTRTRTSSYVVKSNFFLSLSNCLGIVANISIICSANVLLAQFGVPNFKRWKEISMIDQCNLIIRRRRIKTTDDAFTNGHKRFQGKYWVEMKLGWIYWLHQHAQCEFHIHQLWCR